MSTPGYLPLFTVEKKAQELSRTRKRCCEVSSQRDSLLCSLSPAVSPPGNCHGGDGTKLLPLLHAIPLLQSDRALTEVGARGDLLSSELKAVPGKTT